MSSTVVCFFCVYFKGTMMNDVTLGLLDETFTVMGAAVL